MIARRPMHTPAQTGCLRSRPMPSAPRPAVRNWFCPCPRPSHRPGNASTSHHDVRDRMFCHSPARNAASVVTVHVRYAATYGMNPKPSTRSKVAGG